MFANKALASLATTTLFVLLWSSGAIVSKWGLTHASPFAFLLLRFLLANVRSQSSCDEKLWLNQWN